VRNDEEPDRRQREEEWGERMVVGIVLGVVVATLVLAFLFQILS